MLKSALAGAVVLATIGCSFAVAGTNDEWQNDSWQSQNYEHPHRSAGSSQVAMAESRIAEFKAALRLKPEQERHWPRVAAALRDFVARQANHDSNGGSMVQRISDRASSFVLNANSVRRLVAAAQPLVKSLDQEQKQVALGLANQMGFGDVAAHFN